MKIERHSTTKAVPCRELRTGDVVSVEGSMNQDPYLVCETASPGGDLCRQLIHLGDGMRWNDDASEVMVRPLNAKLVIE